MHLTAHVHAFARCPCHRGKYRNLNYILARPALHCNFWTQCHVRYGRSSFCGLNFFHKCENVVNEGECGNDIPNGINNDIDGNDQRFNHAQVTPCQANKAHRCHTHQHHAKPKLVRESPRTSPKFPPLNTNRSLLS